MIIVRYKDFDYAVKGFTIQDEQGDYNIYINSRYSSFSQRKTVLHELKHIKNGDFDKQIPAHLIERQTNGKNCQN